MTNFTRTAFATACTIVFSGLCVLGAVAPASADLARHAAPAVTRIA